MPHFARKAGLVRGLLMFGLPVPLLIMAIALLVAHDRMRQTLEDAIARNSSTLAQGMSFAATQSLRETRNQLSALATGSVDYEEFRERVWRRLSYMNETGDARFCEAVFTGLGKQADKRFVWLCHNAHLVEVDPEMVEYMNRSPLQPPLRPPVRNETVLSGPLESVYSFTAPDTGEQVQTTMQVMRFTTPVYLAEGSLAGYLAVSLELSWMRNLVNDWTRGMGDGREALTFFVDRDGWMIFEGGTGKTGPGAQDADAQLMGSIDTVRSGFSGDFGRIGYSQAFRPGSNYYSYWTMMNHIRAREAGQFFTSRIPWTRDGLPVEIVSYAPVTYASGLEGHEDVIGGLVVLNVDLEEASTVSFLYKAYLAALGATFLALFLSLYVSGRTLRRYLSTLGKDIAASSEAALATPLPDRPEPREIARLREAVNGILSELRNLEDERDMEDSLATARMELEAVPQMPVQPRTDDGIIGVSSEIDLLRKSIRQAAKVRADVLVTGETGTGKELVSRAIHQHAVNGGGPFVTINCGALDEGLLMDSLFGHVKGAFTEARESRKGAFLAAEGGTLMLDEIGTASLKVQQALLRALSDRCITPLGSDEIIPFNTRVIAATNADLREEIQRGTFREDLYFRLAVITIRTPALREHKMDIPHLVMAFLQEAHERSRTARPIPRLSKGALTKLMHYHWPGNVRELRNTVFRAALFCDGDLILPGHLHLGSDQGMADPSAFFRDEPGSAGRDSSDARQTMSSQGVPQDACGKVEMVGNVDEHGTAARKAADDARTLPDLSRFFELVSRLEDRKVFSRKEYQDMTGVSMRTAQYDLLELTRRGLVSRMGNGRTLRYELNDEAIAKLLKK